MKGGHLARNSDGRLVLREIAQCPEEDLAAFQDITKFRYFNVNSLWIDLQALKSLVRTTPVIHLPLILNPKTLDPRDADSPPVFQVETAMGAAISLFDGATAVKVPPTRFQPVKKCADLLALRSDRFIYQADGSLVPTPATRLKHIQVNLDPAFYTKIDDFEKRFSYGVPSLIDCEALTIRGDVSFERDVVIKGNVCIHNTGPEPAVISAGTVIDNNLSF
jgi:UTP--glucose-1-phosphate uridylyltransferase